MTAFFATPEETQDWLRLEATRLSALLHEEQLPAGSRRSFLWPRGEPPLPPPLRGVQVWHPTATATVLSEGYTGWLASVFDERTATVGRRLSRSLTRSLRKRATVPLFAMSLDEAHFSTRPVAWGTHAAVSSGLRLRQFTGAGCWFVTQDVAHRSAAAASADEHSLYEAAPAHAAGDQSCDDVGNR